MRKITPLEELVEYVSSKEFASDEVMYLHDPAGWQEYVSSIVLSEEDKRYLKDRAHFMYLQDIPVSEWSRQDFLDFSVITLHLTELETGRSTVDDVNEYIASLDLTD
jgi:hypothetical protein